MSKILKSSYVQLDDNRLNINVPMFGFEEIKGNFDDLDDLLMPEEESDSQTEEKIIENANLKAKSIIEQAKNEAEKIISDAKDEAQIQSQKILSDSKKEGYNEGYKKAEQEAEEIIIQSQELYDKAVSDRESIIKSIEPEMVELVINVCSKILFDSIEINPHIIMNLIKQGLNKTTVTGDISVHVSEYDYKVVLENKEELFRLINSNTKIEIIKDFNLNKGDCIIETPFGNIDCSLEQQFEGIKQSLYYILENR